MAKQKSAPSRAVKKTGKGKDPAAVPTKGTAPKKSSTAKKVTRRGK